MLNTIEKTYDEMTLEQIDQEINRLNNVRLMIIERDKATVIKQIKEQMELHGITLADLEICDEATTIEEVITEQEQTVNAHEQTSPEDKKYECSLTQIVPGYFFMFDSDSRLVQLDVGKIIEITYEGKKCLREGSEICESHGFVCVINKNEINHFQEIFLDVPHKLLHLFILNINNRLILNPSQVQELKPYLASNLPFSKQFHCTYRGPQQIKT